MKFYYFDQLPSTQSFLENQSFEKNILVSVFHQSAGRGRGDKRWTQVGDGVCFSFTWNREQALALKVAISMKLFLKQYFDQNFYLKWPNDLVNFRGEKVGGFLVSEKKEGSIVGVGLNINHTQGVKIKSSKEKLTFIFPQLFFSFFRKRKLDSLLDLFNESCYHLNDFVEIHQHQGFFKGINSEGEALLATKEGLVSVREGSLYVRKRN